MTRYAIVLVFMLGAASPALAQSPDASAPPSSASQLEAKPEAFSFFSAPLAAGAGAAVLAAPASLAMGIWLGSLSNNLTLAALPAVVAFVAIPPVAVVLAEWAVANLFAPGVVRVSPVVWATVGAQVLVLAAAILLGAHGANFGDAALLTLVEAIVLPGTSWWVMRATAPSPPPLPPTTALDDRFQLPRVARIQVASWNF
ncbi:MAG: hypothetical protein IRZ16_16105 [Myxococcaceae bacterium]|nr:hypothetical protein [Myxococcaceae bacterium]